MPITKRGVYHNLKESKYVVSNGDITFFFSSVHTLNKFMNGYTKHREYYYKRNASLSSQPLNYNVLSDIEFYKSTEKRGFYVWLKGVSINDIDLYYYALRKMVDEDTPNWNQIERPKVGERFGKSALQTTK